MIKLYFKQAWQLMRESKLLSVISIIGTALAIAMIMCIVLIYQARTGNYEPEVNRDRTLSIGMVVARNIGDEGWNNSNSLSLSTIKRCFYPLESPEVVTAYIPFRTLLASTPGGTTDTKCSLTYTDDAFWKVFQFRFLSGKPYGEEFASGVKTVVVSRSLARKVFGTDDVVGRTLSLSLVDYTVCGVVADVSLLAEHAYAEAWAPYTTYNRYEEANTDDILGSYHCCILAPDTESLEVVRQEAQRRVDAMNAAQKDFKMMLFGGPDTQLMSMSRDNAFEEPNVTKRVLTWLVVIFILLLVPAINLSGITLSRMRRRMEEMGVRRAFGAGRGELLRQVLTENLVVTLIGGMIGWIFSYIAVLGMREWLLNTSMSGWYGVDTAVSSGMILTPGVFGCALLFCLLMNLLSAGIPAWRVSRTSIVNSFK